MSFRGFLKTLSYILGIFITVLILSGISYLIVDGINKKSNVMDIGDYSPVSTLVVPENPRYKSKFPFVDVHSHHWDMPVKDLSKLVFKAMLGGAIASWLTASIVGILI